MKIFNFGVALVATLFVMSVQVHAAETVKFPNFNIRSSTASSGLKKQEVISEFSTEFNTNSKGKAHNIKLSSIAVDQYVINPGEIFSFNEVIGYASQAQGYMKAIIFVDGKEREAYGGGICQVSSTLYNAALEAGMEIVERHPHSKKVFYVPEGKDAATSYNGKDFKFKNNFDYPVTINTYINDNIFTSQILKG